MTTLGERIRTRREACEMSLTELARASGVSRGYLHLLEKGESDPTLSVAVKIADALGVTVNALAYDGEMPDHTDVVKLRTRIAKALDALADARADGE